MNNSNSQIKQIKKIVRRWAIHVIYVFVAIIIVFFNLSFTDIVVRQSADLALTAYPKLLEEFLTALSKAAKPIAFRGKSAIMT